MPLSDTAPPGSCRGPGRGGHPQFINVLLNLLSLQHSPSPEMLPKVLLGWGMFGNCMTAEALSQPNQRLPGLTFYYHKVWGF